MTQESAHFLCLMIVVNRDSSLCLLLSTDSAPVLLLLHHSVVLLLKQLNAELGDCCVETCLFLYLGMKLIVAYLPQAQLFLVVFTPLLTLHCELFCLTATFETHLFNVLLV